MTSSGKSIPSLLLTSWILVVALLREKKVLRANRTIALSFEKRSLGIPGRMAQPL